MLFIFLLLAVDFASGYYVWLQDNYIQDTINGSSLAPSVGGDVYSWGGNFLGDGSTSAFDVPQLLPVFRNKYPQLATAGSAHSLVQIAGGFIFSWGMNDQGQLGIISSQPYLLFPSGIADMNSRVVVQTSARGESTMVVCDDGQIFAWGSNRGGKLGFDTALSVVYEPTRLNIPNSRGFVMVSLGDSHTLGLDMDGKVWSWGQNDWGQLGRQGSATPDTIPFLQSLVVTQISSGNDHCLALISDGTLYTWGRNYRGQLGLGDTRDRLIPIKVPSVAGCTSVAAGRDHSLLVVQSKVYSMGRNDAGELGLGDFQVRLTPTMVQLPVRAWCDTEDSSLLFSAYLDSVCVNSNTRAAASPQLPLSTTPIFVVAGSYHSFAVTDDGNLFAWGLNANGQTGVGPVSMYGVTIPAPRLVVNMYAKQVTSVAAGEMHTVARSSRDVFDVYAISPLAGPVTGGTPVFVFGRGLNSFKGNISVLLTKDGIVKDATAEYFSTFRLRVVTPSLGATSQADEDRLIGFWGMTFFLDGVLMDTPPLAFSYFSLPTVLGSFPHGGPRAGNSTTFVYGSGFDNATATDVRCKFGNSKYIVPATIVSSSSILCYSPLYLDLAPLIGIYVTLNGQDYSFTWANYYYYSHPTLTSMAAPTPYIADFSWLLSNATYGAPFAGGSILQIIGAGFADAPPNDTVVYFDATPSPAVLATTATTLVIGVPPLSTANQAKMVNGSYTVVVKMTLNRQDIAPESLFFTYYNVPSIYSISPQGGPSHRATETGSLVIVTGIGFTRFQWFPRCKFGLATSSAYVLSDTQLACMSPESTPQVVNFTLGMNAQDFPPSTVKFTFYAQPSLSNVVPYGGVLVGNTSVTVVGTGFFTYQEKLLCRFGPDEAGAKVVYQASPWYDPMNQRIVTFLYSVPATIISDSQIRCTAPSVPSPIAINAQISLNGQSFTSSSSSTYSYYQQPWVTSCVPAGGPFSGGTQVQLRGVGLTNFVMSVSCRFGNDLIWNQAINRYVPDPKQITPATLTQMTINSTAVAVVRCQTPVWEAGINVTSMDTALALLSISLNGQDYDNSSSIRFTYYRDPEVATLNPVGIPTTGGSSMVIFGRGFRRYTEAVKIKLIDAAGNYTVFSPYQFTDAQLFAISPPHAPGTVSVTVSLNGEDFVPNTERLFSFYRQPTISNVEPPGSAFLREYITDNRLLGTSTVTNITGSGFRNHDELVICRFDKYFSPGSVKSDNQLLCEAPKDIALDYFGQVLDVNVEITLNGQDFTNNSGLHFRYFETPKFPRFWPKGGPDTGNTVVTFSPASNESMGYERFNSGNLVVNFGGQKVLCERQRAKLLLNDDFDPSPVEVEPGVCDYNSDAVYQGKCPKWQNTAAPSYEEVLQQNIDAYTVDISLWEAANQNGTTASNGCGSIHGKSLLFTGLSYTVFGRNIVTAPLDLSRGAIISLWLKRGSGIAPSRCEVPEALDILTLRTMPVEGENLLLYPRNASVSLAYWEEWIEMPQWNVVAEFDVKNYSDFTQVQLYITRDPRLIVCPLQQLCQNKWARIMLSQPVHAQGPFDNWAIDDINVYAAGGIENDSTLSCTTPPPLQKVPNDGLLPINLTVSMNGQQFYPGGTVPFVYYKHPTIQKISPTGGPTLGGTVITVIGNGFSVFRDPDIPVKCQFGTNQVVATVISNLLLQCLAPKTVFTGLVAVEVALNGLDFSNTNVASYMYYKHPPLYHIYPQLGQMKGGTHTVVVGTGFVQLNVFGVNPICRFAMLDDPSKYSDSIGTVLNDTMISCITPNYTEHFTMSEITMDALVQISLNQIDYTTSDNLTYVFYQEPQISSITPDSGSNTLPNPITVRGAYIRNGTDVECVFKSTEKGEALPHVYTSKLWKNCSEILCQPPTFPGQKILQSSLSKVGLSFNGIDVTLADSKIVYTFSTPEPLVTTVFKVFSGIIGSILLIVLVNVARQRYVKTHSKYVSDTDGDWIKPSIKKALQHQNQACPRKYGSQPYPIWKTTAEELGTFGIGLGLYFQLLKYMGTLFLLMALISSPMSLVSQGGTAYINRSDVGAVVRGMIGNVIPLTTDDPTYSVVQVGGSSISANDAALIIACVDLLLSLLFLYATMRLKSIQQKVIKVITMDTIDASAYTVLVEDIPYDATDPDELKTFFSKYGEVADASIAFDNGSLITLFQKRRRLEFQMEVATAKFKLTKLARQEDVVKKLAKKIRQMDMRIQALRNKSDFRSIVAFVTFNHDDDAQNCIEDYQSGFLSRVFVQQRKLFRGRYLISVSRAVEPTSINWENLQHRSFDQTRRKMVTNLVAVIMLGASFVIILVTKGLKESLTIAGGDYLCITAPSTNDPNAQEKIRWSRYSVGEATFQVYLSCYCKIMLSQQPEFCQEYVYNEIRLGALTLASIGGVVAINLLLKIVLKQLARLEKHHTIDSEERAVAIKIFIAQFMNTALIQLAVNARLDYFFPSLITLRDQGYLSGAYTDFTSDWYAAVGYTIAITVLTNAFTPNFAVVSKYPQWVIMRLLQANRQLTQAQLDQLYEGPTYMLSERYGILLNMMFTIMLYSSGMPVLLWFAFLFFTVAYWCDKIALLRVFKKPAPYDQQLAVLCIELMPYCVLLHCMFAVWMVGALPGDTVKIPEISDLPIGSLLRNRLWKANSLPSLGLLLILITWTITSTTVAGPIYRLYQRIIGKADDDRNQTNPSFIEALENMELTGLESYQIKKNPRYADAMSINAVANID